MIYYVLPYCRKKAKILFTGRDARVFKIKVKGVSECRLAQASDAITRNRKQ